MKKKLNGQAPPRTVICKTCGKRKKLKDMAKRTGIKWNIRPYCRLCWNAYMQSYKKSPKGRIAIIETSQRYWNKQKELKDADAN